jgi:hypothetical protein
MIVKINKLDQIYVIIMIILHVTIYFLFFTNMIRRILLKVKYLFALKFLV